MSAAPGGVPTPAERGRLGEVAAVFLKMGVLGFGGPAAHVALMRQEVVRRRHWLDDQGFLDLLGASNLIPGPTSTELAIYLGYARAGPAGLLVGGVLFILPSMLLVLGFAWTYVAYGATPEVAAVLYGIKPVIIAVIVQAIVGLLRPAARSAWLGVVVVLSTGIYLVGVNPLVPLLGLGAATALAMRRRPSLAAGVSGWLAAGGPAVAAAAMSEPFSLGVLFLTFLKIGATLYGSGYVLLAFLRDDFVGRLGWLSDQQIVDAVAVGQFTPGPVFTTATFIGYVLGGVPGALAATLAVFLPGFVLVTLVYPLVPRLRRSRWSAAFLDGANAAAVGLMVGVAWQLTRTSIVDLTTAALAVVAAGLLLRTAVNSAWLVAGGAAVGLLVRLVSAV